MPQFLKELYSHKWKMVASQRLLECYSIDLIDNRIKLDHYVTSSGEDDGIYVR